MLSVLGHPFQSPCSLSSFSHGTNQGGRSHNLRYVLRHRSTGKVYFVVVFAVMLLEDLANEAANEAAEKDAKKAKDEEFEPKEDDLD